MTSDPHTPAHTDEVEYVVVLNHEEQYSIWHAGREIPAGWRAEGFRGAKEACLAHIATVWTDMRPLSLRQRMPESSAGRE